MQSDWPAFDYRGPTVTSDDVRAFEEQLGASLPDDYRAFLVEVNGGQPVTHDRFAVGRDRTILNSFLSLNDRDGMNDLAEANALIRDDLPSDLVYVGYDDGGSRVYLCVRGERRGQVWYFDTVNRRPEGSNPRVAWHDRRDFFKLADSFRAFVSSLTPP